jgi:hypothetical protein
MAAQRLDGATHVVRVYVAGATHVFEFLKPLGAAAYKVGVTGCRKPGERIRDLRRSCYAGVWKRPSDRTDAGVLLRNANEWFLSPVTRADLGHVPLPENIEIVDGHLMLRAPLTVSVEDADLAVHALLRPRNLREFFRRSDGRQRLIAAGHDPSRWFHTSYDLVETEPRVTPVEELYLLRPKRELPALITALGALMQRWWLASSARS